MKKLLTFILSAIFLLGMFSCSKPSGDAAAQPTCEALTPRPYEPGLTYQEVYNPDTDFDNRYGRGYIGIRETEDAYYFDFCSKYAYYYDKASGEYGVLCGKPDCEHDAVKDNRNCNGYIDSKGGGTINLWNGKLYYASYYATSESPCLVSLFRMNPDGTQHERVFPFTCPTQYFGWAGLELHRDMLYGRHFDEVVVNGEPLVTCNVSCWNIETGEYKLIYERYGNTSTSVVWTFYFGKYVYICDSYWDYDAPELKTNIEIARWDSEEEKLETVYHGDGYGGANYGIWVDAEDKIYFAPTISDTVNGAKVYCLRSGEVEIALDLGEPASIRLLDGAVVAFWLPDGDPEARRVVISDYDGNLIYKGGWTYEGYGEYDDYDSPSIDSVFGDRSSLYMVYGWRGNGANNRKRCVVKYDLTDPELKATVLYSGKGL